MSRLRSPVSILVPVALMSGLLACEAKKSSNPLSPSVAGPIPGVEITPPKLLEPAQGFKFKENQQPIRLLIENSSSTGVRPITYVFEVASDSNFATLVFSKSGVAPGEGGRTSLQLEALASGRPYYWRVRAEDGANNSTYATAGFELLPRAQLGAPAAVSPVNNERVASRRPTLRIRNADRNAAVGGVSYFFVVARDQAFTQVAAAGIVDERGDTTWTVDADLAYNLTHFWRVRATDGEVTSDWSATQAFLTPLAPSAPAPGPGAPPPGGANCNTANTHLAVVQCERSKFGFMSHNDMLALMRNIARSLNAKGLSGGPYGILRKTSGNNCGGYSCDIICAGQGNGQQQYDVLGDIEGSQTPGWAGPHTVPHIRIDACMIQ